MLSGLILDKLVFYPDATDEGSNVGAFLRSKSGNLITSTTDTTLSKELLDVTFRAEKQEDAAHASSDWGSFVLAVRNDAGGSLVSDDGDYAPLQVDSTGRLRVIADLTTAFDYVYPEDSAAQDADPGAFILAVRQDTLSSLVSADGDYGAFKINDRGALWTVPVGTVDDDNADAEYPIKVGSKSVWGALTAISTDGDRANLISDKYRRIYINDGANISAINNAVEVANTATQIYAGTGNLDGRRTILIQNLGNKAIYIGTSSVTASNGIRVASNASIDLDIGPNIDIYAISTSTQPQDVRVLELG